MSRIKFMNIEIDNLTFNETITEIDTIIRTKVATYVVTPNLDHIVQLERSGELCEAYKNAELILADGKPLIWISKLYKTPIKEKISGSDLFPRLCEMAAEKGYSMFFLGVHLHQYFFCITILSGYSLSKHLPVNHYFFHFSHFPSSNDYLTKILISFQTQQPRFTPLLFSLSNNLRHPLVFP